MMASRDLTAGEWAELSDGLAQALRAAGVRPRVAQRAHPAAWVAAIWRGSTPIMAVGRTIWWPGAKADFAGDPAMAVVQHELQHLLDYADGRLSVIRYLLWPWHWIYRYDLSRPLEWRRLGAEQRASLAEDLWRSERRHTPDAAALERMRTLIPWARAPGD
jgi:hypothetical protein